MQFVRGDTIIDEEALTEPFTYDLNLNGANDAAAMDGLCLQVSYTNATPSAKTFDSGESEVSTATFAAQGDTDPGDYIVIYDTAGLGWAVAADITGSDPAPTGAVWTSIAAGRKAQVDLSLATDAASVAAAFEVAFDALTAVPFATDDSAGDGTMIFTVTLRGPTTEAATYNEDDSGAGSIAVVVTNAGVASEVNAGDEELTIPDHGLTTGLVGQLTTTGTLPTGYSLATNYYVIVIDENTIQLASSLANASAGTPVLITSQGADGSVNTFTPTALGGATVALSTSNDGVNFDTTPVSSFTVTIAAAGTKMWNIVDPFYQWLRIVYTPSAGAIGLTVVLNGKLAQP